MTEFEYIRHTTLKVIKKNFLQHCGLSNNEAIKVWANWVINNRVRETQIDEFLPTEHLELDNKTVSLLIEKGIGEEEAINFYSNFIQQCQRWKYRLEYYQADNKDTTDREDEEINDDNITLSLDNRGTFPPGLPVKLISIVGEVGEIGDPILTFSIGGSLLEENLLEKRESDLVIDYRGLSHKVDILTIRRILRTYQGKHPKFNLWKLLNSYSLLDGLSYQWSLPPETFSLLTSACGLKTELFASPLNHHVAYYYSLFELDRKFGSSGDFFHSTWSDFEKGGFFEANPPFIESIFIRASLQILTFLELANSKNVDLAFMFIMPDWLDSFAYRMLKSSSFLRTELILKKGQHKYWEYRKNRLIQANFNTHVFILTSNEGFFHKLWSETTESLFLKSMSY